MIKATVQNGKPVFDDLKAFNEAFYKFEGKRIHIDIKALTKQRSRPQNAYYWSVIVPNISDATGYDKNETHDMLKMEFLKVHRDNLPPTIKRTRDLTTKEFEEYCEDIRRWASTFFGLYIPEPNESYYD